MTDAGESHAGRTNSDQARSIGAALDEARQKWGWFVALGAFLILLGSVAMINLTATTIATVVYLGVLMLVGGALQAAQAFRIKTWSGFGWWLLSGILYSIAGITALANPLFASFVLTLLLALFTLSAGISRIVVGLRTKPDNGWTVHVASGAVSTLVGTVFLLGWPVNSLWLLGLLLSVDLIFQGLMCAVFGIRLKAPRQPVSTAGAT